MVSIMNNNLSVDNSGNKFEMWEYRENQVVIAVSGKEPKIKYSVRLSEHVANIYEKFKGIVIESLYPIPILYFPKGDKYPKELREIIQHLIGNSGIYRIIAGIGNLECGDIGGKHHIEYHCTGEFIMSIVDGVLSLPLSYSWVDKNVRETLELKCDIKREV